MSRNLRTFDGPTESENRGGTPWFRTLLIAFVLMISAWWLLSGTQHTTAPLTAAAPTVEVQNPPSAAPADISGIVSQMRVCEAMRDQSAPLNNEDVAAYAANHVLCISWQNAAGEYRDGGPGWASGCVQGDGSRLTESPQPVSLEQERTSAFTGLPFTGTTLDGGRLTIGADLQVTVDVPANDTGPFAAWLSTCMDSTATWTND